MRTIIMRTIPIALSAVFLLAGVAQAGLLDSVDKALGSSANKNTASDSGSLLDSLAIPSLQSAGPANVTGVLQYCINNNYLGGGSTGITGKLTSLLGGQEKTAASPDYQSGLKGILGGNSGEQLDLGSGDLKGKIVESVCDKVLEYGKSLLK
jgi:hypothetical protein